MNPFEMDSFSTEDILASMRPRPKPPGPLDDPSMEAVRASGAASHGLPQLAPLPAKAPPELRSNTLGGSRYGPAVNPGPELDYAIGRGAGLNPFEAGPGLWDQGRKAIEDWRSGQKERSVAEFWGPQVLGIFAGPKAKTANLMKLERAKRMAGKYPEADILRETGWSQTRDGNWQFEINDNPARLTKASRHFIDSSVPGIKTQGTAPLSQMFEHKALVKAYPEVADLRSTLMYEGGDITRGSSGGFGTHPETGKFIYATFNRKNDPNDIRKSFLHELNHWVADQEGFDPGTSPRTWSKPEFSTLVETTARGLAERDGLNFDQMMPEMRDKYLNGAAMGLYYQTIGEVASRNVERRAGMTAQQRKEKEPRSTEDVAWEYQLPSPQRMTKRDDGKYEVKKEGDDESPFEIAPLDPVRARLPREISWALDPYGEGKLWQPWADDKPTLTGMSPEQIAKAEAAGFDTSRPLYRGSWKTNADAMRRLRENDDLDLDGPVTQDLREYPYFTDKPRIANHYAFNESHAAHPLDAPVPVKGFKTGANIQPVWARKDGVLVINYGEHNRISKKDLAELSHKLGRKFHSYPEPLMEEIANAARDKGYNMVEFRNMTDWGGPQTQYLPLRGGAIRSPWAKFDPANANKADLLAGLAGAATIPLAGTVLVDDDNPFTPSE